MVGDIQLDLVVSEDPLIQAEIETAITIVGGRFQDKAVIPSDEIQVISADPGYSALSSVTIDPIPSNYGRITWDGSVLTVS